MMQEKTVRDAKENYIISILQKAENDVTERSVMRLKKERARELQAQSEYSTSSSSSLAMLTG
jgi:hypothetical protein